MIVCEFGAHDRPNLTNPVAVVIDFHDDDPYNTTDVIARRRIRSAYRRNRRNGMTPAEARYSIFDPLFAVSLTQGRHCQPVAIESKGWDRR